MTDCRWHCVFNMLSPFVFRSVSRSLSHSLFLIPNNLCLLYSLESSLIMYYYLYYNKEREIFCIYILFVRK